MDFSEISDLCGYDMEKANEMAKEIKEAQKTHTKWIDEALEDCGLETLSKQSVR